MGRREVRDLILSLRAAGRTVLFSSHILQDVEMICDRIGILDQGKLRSAAMPPSWSEWGWLLNTASVGSRSAGKS